jgi:DNA-binding transcriptional LysR family regulator
MARRPYSFPSLNALATFEAAGRHMSFTEAATELNVTPSAVSKQIKLLEDEAGGKLFVRLHRALDFTPEGAALHATLQDAFSHISAGFDSLAAAQRARTVSIGSTSAFAQFWLMPRLGRFWKDNQDIVVDHVISDRGHDKWSARVDLRVHYGERPLSGEEGHKLFDDRILALVGPSYRPKRPIRSLVDLMSENLLSVEGVDRSWTNWPEFFRALGAKPARLKMQRFNSYVIAVQAARNGQGLVLGWERLLAPLIAESALRQVRSFAIKAPGSFYLCHRQAQPLSSAAETLQDWLLNHVD